MIELLFGKCFAIAPGWVVDGRGSAPIQNAAVVVEGERILEVCRKDQVADADFPVHAFPEMTLLPGLIDAHVHLTCSPHAAQASNFLEDAIASSDAKRLLRAAVNAREALAAGITTVRDLGGKDDLVFEVKEAIEDGTLTGPHLLAAGRPLTCPRGHCYFMGGEVATAGQILRLIGKQIDKGADVVKVMASGGGLTPGTGLLRRQFSHEDLALLVKESRRRDKPVAAHVAPTPLIQELAELGVDTLEHCAFFTPNGVAVDMEVMEKIRQSGAYVVPTKYQFYLRRDLKETSGGLKLEIKATYAELYQGALDILRACRALGVRIAAGSDAGVPNVFFNGVLGELELMVTAGYSAVEAVASATGSCADALRIGHERGSVKAKMCADLLLVEGPVHEDISNLRNTRMVFKDGKLVVDNREKVPSPQKPFREA